MCDKKCGNCCSDVKTLGSRLAEVSDNWYQVQLLSNVETIYKACMVEAEKGNRIADVDVGDIIITNELIQFLSRQGISTKILINSIVQFSW